MEIHVIELQKELTGQGEVDDWIRFFNVETEEDIKMIRTKNPGIQEAVRELRRMSMNNPVRLLYEAHLKKVRDERARELYVRNRGKEEGRAEGRAEERAENILELLKMRGPVPDELKKRIRSEKDISRLKEWFRLAAQSGSVKEFQNKI